MGNRLRDLRQERNERGKWTVADAAAAFGYSESGYLKLEVRKSVKTDIAEKAAEIYGVSIDVVMGNKPLTQPQSRPLTADILPHPNARIGGPVDLRPTGETIPVFGVARGGSDGEFLFNGNELAYINTPPFLKGVAGAYAVYVAGESMEPRYLAGETVFVHPTKPVRSGDFVVIQLRAGDGEAPHGFIKQFISRDSRRVKVRQFSPAKTVEFAADRIVSIHKIVGSEHL